MSTAPVSSSPESTDHETACEYDACDSTQDPTRDDGYCSKLCWYREKAAGLFSSIKYDHRYCSNCYRKLREVYPPGRRLGSKEVFADGEDDSSASMTSIPECAIGRAYPTPWTVEGERERLRPSDPPSGDWRYQPTDHISIGMICECGAAHHQTIFRPVQTARLMDHAKRLSDSLDVLLSEDKHPYHHNRDTLLDTVRDRKTDPDDNAEDQQILIDALAEALMSAKPIS